MSNESIARSISVVLRACAGIARGVAATATMSILVSTVALPPQLALRSADAQITSQKSAQQMPSPDVSGIELAFLEEVTGLDLIPVGTAAFAGRGDGLWTIVLGATAPLGRPQAPTFFMRRTAVVAARPDGRGEVLATSDLILRYLDEHATVEFVDRFSEHFDQANSRASGLSGMEIRRTAELDIPDLEAIASTYSRGAGAGQPQLSELVQRGEIKYDNYVEKVTVTDRDGHVRTFAGGDFNLGEILGDGSAAGAIDCIRTCFSNAGGDIGLLTIVCIISGAAVCAVGCAVTVGVACLPCIAAVASVCGVVIPAGGAAVCTAQCLFPGAQLPTPTQARTRTPTRTATPTATVALVGCVGDCDQDGEVTVDEILSAIGIALGTVEIDRCLPVDTNGDEQVTVDEILTAMNFALNGCRLP